MKPLVIVLACLPSPGSADTVFAVRTIPAHTVIAPNDIVLQPTDIPGAATDPTAVIGLETRIAIFANRPVSPADLGLPAVVERNGILPLVYRTGSLAIETEGRALDRAGPGDAIRVMNLASRNTVTAVIGVDGAAYVNR